MCAAVWLRATPHPSPLPQEREPVVGGATALTRGRSLVASQSLGAAVWLRATPHPSPFSKGEGASGDENPSLSALRRSET